MERDGPCQQPDHAGSPMPYPFGSKEPMQAPMTLLEALPFQIKLSHCTIGTSRRPPTVMDRAGPCQQPAPFLKAMRVPLSSSPAQVPREVEEWPSFWEALAKGQTSYVYLSTWKREGSECVHLGCQKARILCPSFWEAFEKGQTSYVYLSTCEGSECVYLRCQKARTL